MMFEWTADMIRFMKDAAEYGDYNERLAAELLRFIPAEERGSVCDAGCGLGHLSLELAKYFREVTSVDVNGDALAVLKENATLKGLRNILPIRGDAEEMKPENPYDVMVFCLMGSMEEILSISREQCRGTVLAVKRSESNKAVAGSGSSADKGFCRTELLDESGIPYRKKSISLELGQPFRSREDALLFFRTYRREETQTEETELLKKLQRTDREDFPYYMPYARELDILCWKVSDSL